MNEPVLAVSGYDARDPFATFVPSEKRNQAGGTVGGAIKKDKLFYFLSTEITRRNFPMLDSLNTVAVSPTTQTWIGCGVGTPGIPAATPAPALAPAPVSMPTPEALGVAGILSPLDAFPGAAVEIDYRNSRLRVDEDQLDLRASPLFWSAGTPANGRQDRGATASWI